MLYGNAKIGAALDWAASHYFNSAVKASPAFHAGLIEADYIPGLYRLATLPGNERENVLNALRHFGEAAAPADSPWREGFRSLMELFLEELKESEPLQNELTLESAKGVLQTLLRLEAGGLVSSEICPWEKEIHAQFEMALELIVRLELNHAPLEQIMAYSLFANFADHTSFTEGEQVRAALQHVEKLAAWFMERWRSFQAFLPQYPLLQSYWIALLEAWQQTQFLTYVPDNAFEWAFDLFLINHKILAHCRPPQKNWRINLLPRRFALGDDVDAGFLSHSLDAFFVSDDCREALGKKLFVVPVASLQGLNMIEADPHSVNALQQHALMILKGYGNFLCTAPSGLNLNRFHIFVPKGFAGRRLAGNFAGWKHADTCPPLVLRLTGKNRIGMLYPKIEKTIAEIVLEQVFSI